MQYTIRIDSGTTPLAMRKEMQTQKGALIGRRLFE